MDVNVPDNDPAYIKGITGEWVKILKKPDLVEVRNRLKDIYAKGIRSIAICLMHSYTYPGITIILSPNRLYG
jgi:5-oxoprolinase (ATP-hydrolysing)